MVDIQTVSIAIASAGVFVAAIYYVLQLRNQIRMRQSDLLMRMHLAFSSKEYCDAALKVLSTSYKDYDDFIEKYGQVARARRCVVNLCVWIEILSNQLTALPTPVGDMP